MIESKNIIAGIAAVVLMFPVTVSSQEKQSESKDTTIQTQDETITGATANIDFIAKQQQSESLASDLMGVEVENQNGEELGDVNDLVIGKDGAVVGVVIGVGGFLGVGEKNVAVPYETLSITEKDEQFVAVLNSTRDQLNTAPDYRSLDNKPLSISKQITDSAKETYNRVKKEASETYNEAKKNLNQAENEVEAETEKATDGQEQQ